MVSSVHTRCSLGCGDATTRQFPDNLARLHRRAALGHCTAPPNGSIPFRAFCGHRVLSASSPPHHRQAAERQEHDARGFRHEDDAEAKRTILSRPDSRIWSERACAVASCVFAFDAMGLPSEYMPRLASDADFSIIAFVLASVMHHPLHAMHAMYSCPTTNSAASVCRAASSRTNSSVNSARRSGTIAS